MDLSYLQRENGVAAINFLVQRLRLPAPAMQEASRRSRLKPGVVVRSLPSSAFVLLLKVPGPS